MRVCSIFVNNVSVWPLPAGEGRLPCCGTNMERNRLELPQCDAQLTHGCCSSISCELNSGCAPCVGVMLD